MTDFITVFEINRWSNGLLADALFRLFIGVAALIGGLNGVVYVWRKPEVRPRTDIRAVIGSSSTASHSR